MFLEKLEKELNEKDIQESTNVIYMDTISEISNKVYDFNFKDRIKDIVCWYDCHTFENEPVYLPFLKRKESLYCKGIFCSFNCAKSYAKEQKIDTSLLTQYYKFLTGGKGVIYCSPKRETLEIFGGVLSIEMYRESFNHPDYNILFKINYSEYPIIHSVPQVTVSKVTIEEDSDYNYTKKQELKKNIKSHIRKMKIKPEPEIYKPKKGTLKNLINYVE